MRILKITLTTLLLSACVTSSQKVSPLSAPPPPPTAARPVPETLHGVDVTDPYRWLEDQKSPETRAWIDQQNAYTDKVLGRRSEASLFSKRLLQLLNTDTIETPEYRNGRYFFRKRLAGQDVHSIYMREGAAGKDQLLIDAAPLSSDHTTTVGIEDVSADGTLLAYAVRRGGADEVEIHFFDVNQRKEAGPPIPTDRYYGVSLTSIDTPGAYFSRQTQQGPRLYYRPIDSVRETKLFGDGLTRDKILFASLSDDSRYVLIHVFHGSAPKKTDIYLEDLSDSEPMHVVINDLDVRSTAYVAGDKLVIETNWNAPNSRIMITDAKTPERKYWRELVPENKNASIQGTTVAGGRIYVRYLEDVKPRIVGYDVEGRQTDDIRFDLPGSLEDMSGSWSRPVAFFRFSSFALPVTIYEYDVASAKRTVFAQQTAPVNPDDFALEQLFYTSKDGTRIPMFVFYRKGLQRDGTNPTYLGGYGGFLVSQLPSFSPRAIAWAEQGGVFALANLRGGGEYGEEWHRAGMLERKQNTFDDFIAAAESLIREKYTSPQHLGIAGGSNGGLLVTALATQRPDLVSAVICRYPLVDMLRYHQFLVGPYWIPEYGHAEREEDFKWIYPYSPYQHVVKGTKYPAMLFVTGDSDTRVAPLHARKMTALMQSANASERPVLLRYHVTTGHSGGEPVPVQVKNQAEELGFLWWQLR